jgi:DNA-binding LacI/PurR family transcriptional regulator
MRHVAALAGVGLKTVSRVINDEPNVSDTTIARVMDAAQRLNYQPNLHAGSLKRSDRKTHTLGLLVGSVANPFAGALHRAVEDAARERNTAVFAASLDDDPLRERGIVEAFLRRRVDGLILTTITKSQGYLIPEQEHGTPLVFVDREPIGLDADAIVSDNADGAALAVRHLMEHAAERKRGFLEEVARSGAGATEVSVVEDLHDGEAAYRAVRQLIDSPRPPTAIFTSQNLVTIGAIRALRDAGASNTTALVGFDDFVLADLLEPGVTVIAQNPQRIGALAAERIFARLDGDTTQERTYTVPTELIIRGSGEIRPPQ